MAGMKKKGWDPKDRMFLRFEGEQEEEKDSRERNRREERRERREHRGSLIESRTGRIHSHVLKCTFMYEKRYTILTVCVTIRPNSSNDAFISESRSLNTHGILFQILSISMLDPSDEQEREGVMGNPRLMESLSSHLSL